MPLFWSFSNKRTKFNLIWGLLRTEDILHRHSAQVAHVLLFNDKIQHDRWLKDEFACHCNHGSWKIMMGYAINARGEIWICEIWARYWETTTYRLSKTICLISLMHHKSHMQRPISRQSYHKWIISIHHNDFLPFRIYGQVSVSKSCGGDAVFWWLANK